MKKLWNWQKERKADGLGRQGDSGRTKVSLGWSQQGMVWRRRRRRSEGQPEEVKFICSQSSVTQFVLVTVSHLTLKSFLNWIFILDEGEKVKKAEEKDFHPEMVRKEPGKTAFPVRCRTRSFWSCTCRYGFYICQSSCLLLLVVLPLLYSSSSPFSSSKKLFLSGWFTPLRRCVSTNPQLTFLKLLFSQHGNQLTLTTEGCRRGRYGWGKSYLTNVSLHPEPNPWKPILM